MGCTLNFVISFSDSHACYPKSPYARISYVLQGSLPEVYNETSGIPLVINFDNKHKFRVGKIHGDIVHICSLHKNTQLVDGNKCWVCSTQKSALPLHSLKFSVAIFSSLWNSWNSGSLTFETYCIYTYYIIFCSWRADLWILSISLYGTRFINTTSLDTFTEDFWW